MRYAAPLTVFVMLTVGGIACELTVNGKGGATGPNAATVTPDPNAANAAATTAAAPTATGPASNPIHATRLRPDAPVTPPPATGQPTIPAAPGTVPAPAVTGANDFGSGVSSPDSLLGQVFFIPPETKRFPDVSTMRPTAVLYAKQLNIAPRSFKDGFPGVDQRFEWFAIRYTGRFTVATAGAYKLHVLSDDGCNILIDGAKVLDNDGVHPPQNHVETVPLTAGEHKIQVDYFQGPKYDIALQFWVTPPGGQERLFTTSL